MADDYWAEFLDQGETPEKVEDEFYDQEIIPLLEQETGLEHPENYEIWEYESGQQMYHDQRQNTNPDQSHGLLESLIDSYNKSKIHYLAGQTQGLANSDVRPYRICIAKNNTRSEMEETHTKAHEGVHLIQFHNFDLDQPTTNEEIVMEGQAEFISSKVFKQHFDWEQPKHNFGPTEKALNRLYNTSSEREKYQVGFNFFQKIHELGGNKAANKALTNPPKGDEIYKPEEWYRKRAKSISDRIKTAFKIS